MTVRLDATREPVVFARVPRPENPWCTICLNTTENANHWVSHAPPVTSDRGTETESGNLAASARAQTVAQMCIIHESCLSSWFRQNTTCPNCRSDVSEDSSPAPSRTPFWRDAPIALIDIPISFHPRYQLITAGILATCTSATMTYFGLLSSLIYHGSNGIEASRVAPAALATILVNTVTTVFFITADRNNNHTLRGYAPGLVATAVTSYILVQYLLTG